MDVIDRYVEVTDNRIFYEYIMIAWITDKPELADELVELLRDRLAHVNLIPYNANPVIDLKESSEKSIQNFKRILEKGWITVTVRESMWREAKWACGQLGYERVKKKKKKSRTISPAIKILWGLIERLFHIFYMSILDQYGYVHRFHHQIMYVFRGILPIHGDTIFLKFVFECSFFVIFCLYLICN